MRSKFGWILGAAALFVMLAGCGKGTPPPPIALPAPLPQTNNYGGGVGAVSCSGAIGQQFSQTPFYGNLSGQNSYSSGNSIQLTLGYQGYPSGASSYQSVLGSALLNLPDLAQASQGYPQQGNQQIPYQFCVTSAPTSGGQPFPGVYAPADRSISLTMYGYVQSPIYQYNPYDPYGSQQYGGTQFSQTPVTVSVGNSPYGGCGAYLYEGRVVGCIEVKLGNNGQPRRYNAQ